MTRLLTSAILVLASSLPVFSRGVQIELDYTTKPCWPYTLDYHSDCVIIENGANSSIKTNIVCRTTARPTAKGDRMAFSMDSVGVTSQLYTPEQQQSIIRKLTGAAFGLALFGGAPVVDTLSTFTVSELSEWDLVIQFAKLLPFVPARQVRKGYTWEENAVYPLMTSMGRVPCEVLRLYRIDSLPDKGKRVCISWNFTYGAVRKAIPDSSILRKVPISGKGTGTAEIDLVQKALLKASVEFRTPVAELGGTRVVWVENTTLTLDPGRACTEAKQ